MSARMLRRMAMAAVGAAAVAGGCASSGGGSGAAGESERRGGGDGVEPMSVVERSALRERAIETLELEAFNEWALLRANALEGLRRAPSRLDPVVRAGLSDENLGVRYAAAMTVGDLRMRGLGPFVEPLVDDPDVTVRAAAVHALRATGRDADPTPLGVWAMSGPADQRMRVVFVLGEMGDASAAPLLRDVARRLDWSDGAMMTPTQRVLLRLQVAEALVKLGDIEKLHTLRSALYPSSEVDFEAAVLAAQALGELGDRESARQLVTLVETRSGEAPGYNPASEGPFLYPKELRLAAARSLAQLGYRDGGFVAEAYLGDAAPAVRAQCAFVLGSIGGASSVRTLEGMLADESGLVRVAAAAGLLEALGG